MKQPIRAKRVVVIGGGVSGLAAAHRLLELAKEQPTPLDVQLLEAGNRVGGVVRTIKQDGFLVEAGPDNFITNKPWALDLTQRLGLSDQLLATNPDHRRAMVMRHGKLVPIPLGFRMTAPTRWWPMLTTPLFSLRGKLRMAFEPFVPARRHNNDESLTSFVTRRFGREMLDRLVAPLVGGIYTANPDTLSVRATIPEFLEMEARHGSLWRGMRRQPQAHSTDSGARYSLFVTFKDGMETLIDRLANGIGPQRQKFGHRVVRLERATDQNDATGHWLVTCQNGQTLKADRVIVAVPACHAGPLLKPLDAVLAQTLSSVTYASSAIVNLAYKRGDVTHPLDAFGFVVPAIEKKKILAGSFSSVKYAGRVPEGFVLLRAFLGGAMQGELLDLNDQALLDAAQDDLGQLLGIKAQPDLFMIHRWPQSMPQYTVGHLDRVRTIGERMHHLDGLELCGNGYEGVGIPDCIHAGEQAAERLLSTKKSPAYRPGIESLSIE